MDSTVEKTNVTCQVAGDENIADSITNDDDSWSKYQVSDGDSTVKTAFQPSSFTDLNIELSNRSGGLWSTSGDMESDANWHTTSAIDIKTDNIVTIPSNDLKTESDVTNHQNIVTNPSKDLKTESDVTNHQNIVTIPSNDLKTESDVTNHQNIVTNPSKNLKTESDVTNHQNIVTNQYNDLKTENNVTNHQNSVTNQSNDLKTESYVTNHHNLVTIPSNDLKTKSDVTNHHTSVTNPSNDLKTESDVTNHHNMVTSPSNDLKTKSDGTNLQNSVTNPFSDLKTESDLKHRQNSVTYPSNDLNTRSDVTNHKNSVINPFNDLKTKGDVTNHQNSVTNRFNDLKTESGKSNDLNTEGDVSNYQNSVSNPCIDFNTENGVSSHLHILSRKSNDLNSVIYRSKDSKSKAASVPNFQKDNKKKYWAYKDILKLGMFLCMVCLMPVTARTAPLQNGRKTDEACKPILSDSTLSEDDYKQIECEISTCINVLRVVYERENRSSPNEWIPVFEGFDDANFHALDSNIGKTLKNRTDYSVFPTKHVLFIESIQREDNGKWRCVVHGSNDEYHTSDAAQIIMHAEENLAKADIGGDGIWGAYANGHKCIPTITDSTPDEDGFRQIECEISRCNKVEKIIFEKTGVFSSTDWTPVFEGLNRTHYRSLETGHEYSLNHRADYTAFHTKHLLYIRPLVFKDEGEWRCVVYGDSNKECTSKPVDVIKYVTPGDDCITIAPSNPKLVNGQIAQFTCSATGIHPEPEVVWTINGIEYATGTADNHKHTNGLWSVRNTIKLGFDDIGAKTLTCVMKTKTKALWLQGYISIDVKESVDILEPKNDMNIATNGNFTFTLLCSGTGFNARIVWKRDGIDISDDDERYNMQSKCDYEKCANTITPRLADPENACFYIEDYAGVYTCAISLKPPYTCAHESPNMNVYVPQKLCNDKPSGLLIGLVISTALCAVSVVTTVVVLLFMRRNSRRYMKANQVMISERPIHYKQDDDICSEKCV